MPEGLTRSQEKKLAKRERLRIKYAERKRAKKFRMNGSSGELPSSSAPKILEGMRALRQERNAMFRADFESNSQRGPIIAIDCDWKDRMTDAELVSLTQQIMYSYATVKKSERPPRLCVLGANDQQMDLLKKLPGADSWFMTYSSTKLSDLSVDSRFTYLTADSADVLDISQVRNSDVLVIGGIVDRNRHKKATLLKAESLALRTAQLPIGEFMPLKSSKVLTVNHVVQILCEVLSHKDWKRALDSVIPDRKRELDSNSD
jgi:tRNA (guanine9-N1)-methyltransferase